MEIFFKIISIKYRNRGSGSEKEAGQFRAHVRCFPKKDGRHLGQSNRNESGKITIRRYYWSSMANAVRNFVIQ